MRAEQPASSGRQEGDKRRQVGNQCEIMQAEHPESCGGRQAETSGKNIYKIMRAEHPEPRSRVSARNCRGELHGAFCKKDASKSKPTIRTTIIRTRGSSYHIVRTLFGNCRNITRTFSCIVKIPGSIVQTLCFCTSVFVGYKFSQMCGLRVKFKQSGHLQKLRGK